MLDSNQVPSPVIYTGLNCAKDWARRNSNSRVQSKTLNHQENSKPSWENHNQHCASQHHRRCDAWEHTGRCSVTANTEQGGLPTASHTQQQSGATWSSPLTKQGPHRGTVDVGCALHACACIGKHRLQYRHGWPLQPSTQRKPAATLPGPLTGKLARCQHCTTAYASCTAQ